MHVDNESKGQVTSQIEEIVLPLVTYIPGSLCRILKNNLVALSVLGINSQNGSKFGVSFAITIVSVFCL